ncbi:MAG: bifunctional diaminohydroxyphosphoribosylaminopyrimidine deaminase/5-amino-6-(5-phosphoribosylamino)uracil reductase RibD, partial [Nitrospirae bacterium]|nr:bifunctional diaminohydroxyphosphoribosylaminopyrimidine deaminase/5-amino-6-(5-phosphoribosylamino)uracil reductase RibD [Nitrospirota bacterium]
MKRCIALAKKAEGFTSPNPMVGALLVKDGKIIAEDYHKKAGTPHAEALVIGQAGVASRGATLFVNLEPCCHREKRTPPCTDAIIAAGIKDVFVAMKDPNPYVAGKGIETLVSAGIATEYGILQEEAAQLNEAYARYITTRTPFVTMKIAMTLDGKIATPDGLSKWITCETSRHIVHHLRGSVDAILSAIGTVKADNPLLTCRIKDKKCPVRIIIDPWMETPAHFNVFQTPPKTIFVTKQVPSPAPAGDIEFIHYGGNLDLKWLMAELGKREITSILIEGGSSLTGHAIEDG